MLTYLWVMNDYGIKPMTTLFLNSNNGYWPNATDVYNPDEINLGNSNFGNANQ